MKTGLMILGVAAVLVGVLWLGQGTGVIAWPPSSFMIDQRPWAVRGLLLAIIGGALLWFAGRR